MPLDPPTGRDDQRWELADGRRRNPPHGFRLVGDGGGRGDRARQRARPDRRDRDDRPVDDLTHALAVRPRVLPAPAARRRVPHRRAGARPRPSARSRRRRSSPRHPRCWGGPLAVRRPGRRSGGTPRRAKRYLVATEPDYAAALTSFSVRTLKLQGGPMSSAECRRFEQRRHAMDAVMLRRCDDAAHDPVHAVRR
ncbi:MAG: hypothetical protein R2705_11380 [Ilumatobacteraceae bacterium]